MNRSQQDNITDLSTQDYKNIMTITEDLVSDIAATMIANKENISVAESVSSGLLQLCFSQGKDASEFFQGGMTVYTLNQKVKHLNVDEEEASQFNCVSPHIAETMALNVAKKFESNWSVAITGYANPVPESEEELFAYFSIAYNGTIIHTEKLELHPEINSLNAQFRYTESILECLKNELSKRKQNE